MRVPRATSDVGDGPVVVLVHGVGIGAWAFADVASALEADHRVLVPHRRGYEPEAMVPASATVTEQVDDLLELTGSLGVSRATWVGVSGGATLVLALAMAAPWIVQAAVVHEPVLGPLAPDLHAVLHRSAARLAASGDVLAFMAALVGEDRLVALPPSAREAIVDRCEVVRAEVPAFLAFAPTAADLASLAEVELVTTVGSVSPEWRHQAAAVLAERAGARVEVLDGARHLPQIEAPEAFEKVIRGAPAAR